MKSNQYRYILVNEAVVRGVSKSNFPILYAVPDLMVPNPKDKTDAEKLIQVIENDPDLLKIVTTYDLKSNSNEWNVFWQKFQESKLGKELVDKYSIERLKEFRISRSKESDMEGITAFDKWANQNLGKIDLPSFQDWWTLSATKSIDPGARSLEDVLKSPLKDYGYQHRAHSGTLLGQRPVGSL